MITISYKAKQLGVFIIKLLIVIAAFFFIYQQLSKNNGINWEVFQILLRKNDSITGIIFILFLSVLNRFLEILKWQNLVSTIHKISLLEATKQVLASLTAGIFTPNGLGEYAGKALYYTKKETKSILFLNIICNGIQLLLTVFFGVIGLFLIGFTYWALIIIAIIILVYILLKLVKKIKIKGYSFQNFTHKLQEVSENIHRKNALLGVARYLVFSHQYYFLLIAFDVNLSYLTLMATITTVYFLASALPSFQFLDFAVKGSIAVYFFTLQDVNDWIVVFITTLMWFLNVVIPVFIGSIYVMQYKPKWK
jgi:hypothetical protein